MRQLQCNVNLRIHGKRRTHPRFLCQNTLLKSPVLQSQDSGRHGHHRLSLYVKLMTSGIHNDSCANHFWKTCLFDMVSCVTVSHETLADPRDDDPSGRQRHALRSAPVVR